MEENDLVDNWDHLSDSDWNKKLDERIDKFNEGVINNIIS